MLPGDHSTRIELCGRLAITLGGEPIEDRLRGRQGRLLFAYLVLNRGRPVRRDELAEALWSESGAPDPDLAPPLSRLRKALGEGRVTGRSELTLELGDGAWVDVEHARERAGAAAAALAARDWRAANEAGREAAELLAGTLLPGLEAPWIDRGREEVEELRLDALESQALAAARLGSGLADGARAARAVIAAAPFRESARVALIEVLRAEGNTAEALRAYEDVRRLLREELGTTPGPALLALHERLLRDEKPAPQRASAPPVPTALQSSPTPPLIGEDLVDRETELAGLQRAIAEARAGNGGIVTVTGPAGIGKSRLLGAARALAGDARVLSARAGRLERDFPFGVVRQLLEPVVVDPALAEQAFSGSAAAAAPLFGSADASVGQDASFAVLHGLYWATLNLADQPLVIAVDDLHWADPASLRFLAYLVRRLEGAPILLLTTVRTGEAPADETLFWEIVGDPAVTAIRPGPLSGEAVAAMVRGRLGDDAGDAFCRACAETTGGNPLLLRQLLSALVTEGIAPSAANADVARALGSRAISSAVLLRLQRLSPAAGKVARACAVLGQGPAVRTLAMLAEVDERDVGRAVRELADAEILDPGPPLAFVHPLVEQAIYESLTATERDVEHTRAADVLRAAGASDEELAGHLLATSPRGERWAAEVLVRAGAQAQQQGALVRAVGLYNRALAEGVEIEDREALMLELAISEANTLADKGFERLHRAIGAIGDPAARVRGAVTLYMGHAMVGDLTAASDAALSLAKELSDHPDYAAALHGYAFNEFLWDVDHWDATGAQLRALRAGIPDTGPGARVLEAVVANHLAMTDGTARQAVALARRALVPQMLEIDLGYQWVTGMIVLIYADAHDALDRWRPVIDHAYSRGSLVSFCGLRMFTGHTLTHRGEIADALGVIDDALDDIYSWGFAGPVLLYWHSFHAWALLQAGELELAERTLAKAPLNDRVPEGMRNVRIVRCELLAAQRRHEQVVAYADDCDARFGFIENPAYKTWQLRKIEALGALGRTTEALDYGDRVLAPARHFGAPRVVGETLRMIGCVKGADGIPELEQSVAVLDGSPARLEFARSLFALGEARARLGDGVDAPAQMRRAHDIARSLGAGLARAEMEAGLVDLGLEPNAGEPTGLEALSYFERQAAQATADGVDPQALADAMFATPQLAEQRLQAVERKLGTRDPVELRRLLGVDVSQPV